MKISKKLKLKSQRFYEKEMDEKTYDKMNEIKLKDRTHLTLKEWRKRNHYDKSLKDLKIMYQK